MKNFNELIHIYKIKPGLSLINIFYQDFLNEFLYIKIIISLYNNFYQKKEILLPFSINFDSGCVIFYNIYKKFNYDSLNTILRELKGKNINDVKFVYFHEKFNPISTPVELPLDFIKVNDYNINFIYTYLESTNYKVYNIIEEHGIIKV
jgi:hypothetical protein